MVVHQVFAVINEEVIENVIVCDNYTLANDLARTVFGESAIAVECTQYCVGIGDFYKEGRFYFKDGETIVKRQNTAEEEAAEAKEKAAMIEQQLSDTQLALAEQYEENITLANSITDTQLAVTEIYEKMEGQKNG